MGAYAGKRPDIDNPFVAEANAVIIALDFAQQMIFQGIDIEGGALEIISKLQSQNLDMSPIGTLIEEAKTKAGAFISYSFMHIGRKGEYGSSLFGKIWVGNR